MEISFLFQGLRPLWCIPFFRTYGVYPFPLFSQENGIHHSFFCFVTSGSGDRPRKEGRHGGGVYFFPATFLRDKRNPNVEVFRQIFFMFVGSSLLPRQGHFLIIALKEACRRGWTAISLTTDFVDVWGFSAPNLF